jgi:hypothetical protein
MRNKGIYTDSDIEWQIVEKLHSNMETIFFGGGGGEGGHKGTSSKNDGKILRNRRKAKRKTKSHRNTVKQILA